MTDKPKRIVMKFGSGILAKADGSALDTGQFTRFASEISALVMGMGKNEVRLAFLLLWLFLMYKASPAQVLFKLRLPNALPSFFTGIRISAGISVIGGITGELFAGSTRVGEGGLGYAIIYASNQMEIAYLFALVFAAAALGFAFFFIVMFLEWLALHNWHESSRAQSTE